MFNREIPMSEETFQGALHEMFRVLATDGFVLSRGSAGMLEQQLARQCRTLLNNPLVSVFQKQSAGRDDK